VERLGSTDPTRALTLVGQLAIELLDHVKLHVVAAMAGKPHDGVGVAQLFERLRHDHQRFLVDVDYPARALTRSAVALPDLEPVIGVIGVGEAAVILMNRLVGGSGHIEQEQRGDVARLLLARLVNARIG
jgi:hypothetical protein